MRPSQLENRIYLAAFLLVFLIAWSMISYLDGRTDEAVRENTEQNQLIDKAIADRDAAQARYDSLAKVAGEGAILEAAITLERGVGQ